MAHGYLVATYNNAPLMKVAHCNRFVPGRLCARVVPEIWLHGACKSGRYGATDDRFVVVVVDSGGYCQQVANG
jgi:hypothetical protein